MNKIYKLKFSRQRQQLVVCSELERNADFSAKSSTAVTEKVTQASSKLTAPIRNLLATGVIAFTTFTSPNTWQETDASLAMQDQGVQARTSQPQFELADTLSDSHRRHQATPNQIHLIRQAPDFFTLKSLMASEVEKKQPASSGLFAASEATRVHNQAASLLTSGLEPQAVNQALIKSTQEPVTTLVQSKGSLGKHIFNFVGSVAGQLLDLFVGSARASNNLVGMEVISGQVSKTVKDNLTTITNSPNAIIHWQKFNIGKDEVVEFIQQNRHSAVLNRVLGGQATQILGQLRSNGQVFVVNPAGLVIGKDAQIATVGFVGSSLDLADQDFKQGKLSFNQDKAKAIAKVLNQGLIKVNGDGTLALVGGQVVNQGALEARNGTVYLLAGHSITINDLANPSISYKVTATNKAVNLGSIVGHKVAILANKVLHGNKVDQAHSTDFADLISNESAYRASISASGEVLLYGAETSTQMGQTSASNEQLAQGRDNLHDGLLVNSGSINVTNKLGKAGKVKLLGDIVVLTKDSRIDASGLVGGQVNIGGDQQGKGTLKLAQNLEVFSGASINVDGTGTVTAADQAKAQQITEFFATKASRQLNPPGNNSAQNLAQAQVWNLSLTAAQAANNDGLNGSAGQVFLWGNQANISGNISAQASLFGGFVETSGKTIDLADDLNVNVDSPNNYAGSWLIDPTFLFVVDSSLIPNRHDRNDDTFKKLGLFDRWFGDRVGIANETKNSLVNKPDTGATRSRDYNEISGNKASYISHTTLQNALRSGNVVLATSTANYQALGTNTDNAIVLLGGSYVGAGSNNDKLGSFKTLQLLSQRVFTYGVNFDRIEVQLLGGNDSESYNSRMAKAQLYNSNFFALRGFVDQLEIAGIDNSLDTYSPGLGHNNISGTAAKVGVGYDLFVENLLVANATVDWLSNSRFENVTVAANGVLKRLNNWLGITRLNLTGPVFVNVTDHKTITDQSSVRVTGAGGRLEYFGPDLTPEETARVKVYNANWRKALWSEKITVEAGASIGTLDGISLANLTARGTGTRIGTLTNIHTYPLYYGSERGGARYNNKGVVDFDQSLINVTNISVTDHATLDNLTDSTILNLTADSATVNNISNVFVRDRINLTNVVGKKVSDITGGDLRDNSSGDLTFTNSTYTTVQDVKINSTLRIVNSNVGSLNDDIDAKRIILTDNPVTNYRALNLTGTESVTINFTTPGPHEQIGFERILTRNLYTEKANISVDILELPEGVTADTKLNYQVRDGSHLCVTDNANFPTLTGIVEDSVYNYRGAGNHFGAAVDGVRFVRSCITYSGSDNTLSGPIKQFLSLDYSNITLPDKNIQLDPVEQVIWANANVSARDFTLLAGSQRTLNLHGGTVNANQFTLQTDFSDNQGSSTGSHAISLENLDVNAQAIVLNATQDSVRVSAGLLNATKSDTSAITVLGKTGVISDGNIKVKGDLTLASAEGALTVGNTQGRIASLTSETGTVNLSSKADINFQGGSTVSGKTGVRVNSSAGAVLGSDSSLSSASGKVEVVGQALVNLGTVSAGNDVNLTSRSTNVEVKAVTAGNEFKAVAKSVVNLHDNVSMHSS